MAKEQKELDKELEEMLEARKQGHYETTVEDVELTDSHTFYGTDDYENRKGYVLETKEGNTFFLAIPKSPSAQSKLLNYMLIYGDKPTLGQSIKIDITGEFDKIKL